MPLPTSSRSRAARRLAMIVARITSPTIRQAVGPFLLIKFCLSRNSCWLAASAHCCSSGSDVVCSMLRPCSSSNWQRVFCELAVLSRNSFWRRSWFSISRPTVADSSRMRSPAFRSCRSSRWALTTVQSGPRSRPMSCRATQQKGQTLPHMGWSRYNLGYDSKCKPRGNG